MDTSATPTPATAAPQRLRANSLMLWHVVALGLAYMSLAPAIYFNMGFMETEAGGPVMPLVFIAVTVAILPTAISFAVLNNRRPSAGSAATWVSEALGTPLGLWVGWLLTTLYTIACAIYPAYFAIFFNPFLDYFGVHISFWTGAVAGLAITAVVAWMLRHDVQLSAKSIAIFMSCEAAFVLGLAIYLLVHQGVTGHLTHPLDPFNPAAATAGLSGLSLAVVFGVLSIAGVDSVAPVAEEARTPRSLIPLATILVTLGAGLFWTVSSYGYAVAVPVSTVQHYVDQGLVTPVYGIAGQYIGAAKILVPLTAFSAVIAGFGASAVCASRLLFALARHGYAPRPFARLHPRYQVPWNAAIPTICFAFAAPVVVGVWQDHNASSAAGWFGGVFVFFALISYSLVNLTNIVHHLRHAKDQFNWLTTGLLPALGIVIDGYILYRGFFVSYLGLSFKLGRSIVILSLAWAALGLLWALLAWQRSRSRAGRAVAGLAEELRPTPAGALDADKEWGR